MLKLLEKLGVLADRSASAESDPNHARFTDRVAEMVHRRHGGVEKVAYRIGSTEPDRKVAAAIEKNVGPNDLFVHVKDGYYLVVYPLLGRKESRVKAAKLHGDVVKELGGTHVDLEEGVLGDHGNVIFAKCGDLESAVAELLNESESAVSRGLASDTVEIPMWKQNLAGIDFLYRPMVTLQSNLVSTFIVIPVREIGPSKFNSGYHTLMNVSDAQEILEVDQLTLDQAVVELRRLMAAGGRSLFVVPVHFETLTSPRRRREFDRLCADKLSGIEKRIVFEIVGLPSKIPQARLLELVAALAPYSRAVIARFPPETSEFLDYRFAGLHAVGMDIYHLSKSERALMADMDRFAERARKNRLKSYVLGLGSLSLLCSAVSAGFDYLSGHALGSVCLRAGDIKAFQLDDLYDSSAPFRGDLTQSDELQEKR